METMHRLTYLALLERRRAMLEVAQDEALIAERKLVEAIIDYEKATLAHIEGIIRWHQGGEERAIREAGEACKRAATILKEAFMTVNTLEGKPPFQERKVMCVRWRVSRGSDYPTRL